MRAAIIKRLAIISRYCPPMQVGINPMTDWTMRDLDEWWETTQEIIKDIWHTES